MYSQKINFLDEEIYYYRKQINSITTNKETFRVNAIKSFAFLTKEIERRELLQNNEVLKKFVLSKFIFNIGKKIPKSKQKDIYPHILEHFLYLKSILRFSFIKVTKINFYILIMKIFNVKSFVFFRMLKIFSCFLLFVLIKQFP